MTSRRIAVITVLTMAFSLMGFTVFSSHHGPNNATLPVFVSILAAEATIGMVFAWRTRNH
ncbi:MAG TPA: hypothetical protein VH561_02235 [Micromonosporaceae bacterium]